MEVEEERAAMFASTIVYERLSLLPSLTEEAVDLSYTPKETKG